MELISSVGRNLATDGHFTLNSKLASTSESSKVQIEEAKKVAQDLTENIAQVKADAEQMQIVSNNVLGQKLRFSTNPEFGEVVVAIVDPQTNQVIKEIPSVEQQKIRMRLRKTTGLIFNALV